MSAADPTRKILKRLDEIADELAANEERTKELYAERLTLFASARALDPPVTQSRLAIASRISEVAVTQALRKLRAAKS